MFQRAVAPSFDLRSLPDLNNVEFKAGCIGQQDCKYFFIALRKIETLD